MKSNRRHQEILPPSFNMSWGFMPIVLTIILSFFISHNIALYIGTAISFAYIALIFYYSKPPNFILYISTASLLLLTAAAVANFILPKALPMALELTAVIPLTIIYLNKEHLIQYYSRKQKPSNLNSFRQGAQSSIVAARGVLLFGIIHFILISLGFLLSKGPITANASFVFYQCLPPIVFLLSILFNHLGLRYFNQLSDYTEYLPKVDTKGNVIGKSLVAESLYKKQSYINPVIRIAVSVNGKIFLCQRSTSSYIDRGKIDNPMEYYLRYKETLAEGIQHIIKQTFPQSKKLNPTFSIFYHFENRQTNRLVYLFLLELKDESDLRTIRCRNGKLWSYQQIEQNLYKHFLGENFEEEYEHLKTVIDIREKYKVS